MTKKQFQNLKPGDVIYLNKISQGPDVGKRCVVVELRYWNGRPELPESILVRPEKSETFVGKHKGEIVWEEKYIKFSLTPIKKSSKKVVEITDEGDLTVICDGVAVFQVYQDGRVFVKNRFSHHSDIVPTAVKGFMDAISKLQRE